MVITTNILDREALCEQRSERTVSRLTEMCDEAPAARPRPAHGFAVDLTCQDRQCSRVEGFRASGFF